MERINVNRYLTTAILATIMILSTLPQLNTNTPNNPSGSGLVGYWMLDEGSGTTAYDSSGYDNHGTIYGATWADGKAGKALSFDGVDDYVSVPDSASLDITNEITIEAWIMKPDYTNGWILNKESSYNLEIAGGDNSIECNLKEQDGPGHTFFFGGNFPPNVWTHVAMTYDGNFLKAYLNGDELGRRSLTITIETSTSDLLIGRRLLGTPNYFKGIIDEVRVYNRALSEEEIIFIATILGSISGTVTDAQGTPLSNVTVSLYALNDDGKLDIELMRNTTSTDGSYLLKDVPGGIYNILFAENNYDYALHRVSNIEVTNGQLLIVDAVLIKGGSISGTAKMNGLRVANVSIRLVQDGWMYGLNYTDSNGNYFISYVEPGTYNIRAEFPHDEFGKLVVIREIVSIVSGTTTEDQDINLDSASIGHLLVQARDADTGEFVQVDRILLKDDTSTVFSEAGLYSSNLSDGIVVGLPTDLTYMLKVTAPGYVTFEQTGIEILPGFDESNILTCYMYRSLAKGNGVTATALDPKYAEASALKKYDGPAVYPWIVGQRADVEWSIENVDWKKVSCPENPECFYWRKVVFDLKLKWRMVWGGDFDGMLTAGRWWTQAESEDTKNGPDILWVDWQGPYIIDMDQTSPRPDDWGGMGPWDGIVFGNVPETNRELAREGNAQVAKFTIALRLKPDELEKLKKDCCTPCKTCSPPGLTVRAKYLHSYDGSFYIKVTGFSVGVSYPPSISAGVSLWLGNDRAWTKLFGPRDLPRPEQHCPFNVSFPDPERDLIYIHTGEPVPPEEYLGYGYVDMTKVVVERTADTLSCHTTVNEAPPELLEYTTFHTFMFDENNNQSDNCLEYPWNGTDTMYTVIYNSITGEWTIERAIYDGYWIVEETNAGFGMASSWPDGFSISIWIPLTEIPEFSRILPWKVMTETFNGVSIGDLAPDEGLVYLNPLLGDTDGNGEVDIFDVVTVAKAFGSKLGDPDWNGNADLKPDNEIDIFDVVEVAKNFGKEDC